jgi:hypothetical protein
MSGVQAPKDNSVKLFQMEQAAAREAQAAQEKKDAEARARFDSAVGSNYSTAIDDARAYFTSRGLNPDDYMADIQRAATSARNKIPDLAAAPGTYFENLGDTVYTGARDAKRGQFGRDINTFASDGFAKRRIGDTSDDAVLEAILNEQRGNANNYIKNLLDRGVITGSGYNAAMSDLDTQGYSARSKLNDIGMGVLEEGRGNANELAAEARTRAGNYDLGEQFNPFEYSGELDTLFADFLGNLNSNIRSKAPTSLFNTAGLANVAGAAQGAGNTAFNPRAIAGFLPDQDEEDDLELTALNPF